MINKARYIEKHINGSISEAPDKLRPILDDTLKLAQALIASTEREKDLTEQNKKLVDALKGQCKAYKALCDMEGKDYYKSDCSKYANSQTILQELNKE